MLFFRIIKYAIRVIFACTVWKYHQYSNSIFINNHYYHNNNGSTKVRVFTSKIDK